MRIIASLIVIAVSLLGAHASRADEPAGHQAGDQTVDPALLAFRNGAIAEALLDWTNRAANGDRVAARYLGVLYDTGQGVAQDQATALAWYERAARLGDVPAMFNAAVCFDSGRGTARDPQAAAHWYAMAARHRFGRAEYDLALMTRDGDGVPRDPSRARRLFRDAARDGIEAARADPTARPAPPHPSMSRPPPDTDLLASAQRALLRRSPEAKTEAVALFARAAGGSGPAAAMARYDLAWCMGNGIGVARDLPGAYRMFVRLAAETADPTLRSLAERAAVASDLSATASRSAAAERPAAFQAERSD